MWSPNQEPGARRLRPKGPRGTPFCTQGSLAFEQFGSRPRVLFNGETKGDHVRLSLHDEKANQRRGGDERPKMTAPAVELM